MTFRVVYNSCKYHKCYQKILSRANFSSIRSGKSFKIKLCPSSGANKVSEISREVLLNENKMLLKQIFRPLFSQRINNDTTSDLEA